MKIYILSHCDVNEHYDGDEKLDFGAPYRTLQQAKDAAQEVASYPDEELDPQTEIKWQQQDGVWNGEGGGVYFRIREFLI